MNDNMVGGVVHYRITADDAEFRSSINSADRQAQGFADTLDNGIGSAAQKGFSKAADSAISFATSAVNAISGVVDSVNSMVNNVQSAFERISGINLPSPSSDYLTGAMSTGVQMASTIEGATKGIALMTKDTARAERVMDSVVNKATKTTFNVANLLQYTQQIGSAAGGDYEGALDAALAYGGAMVAAGNGLRDMGLVIRNIQQGYARGYNSVDLRQMKTYIPQFKQVMEMAGLTDEMIINMGVDGAKAVTKALSAWVDAENIWEEYEFTYGNLKESLNEMLQTVTYEAVTESGLFDAIKSSMIQIKNNMPILREGLKDIGSYIAEIVRNVDWAGVLRGVASGIRAIVNTVSVIWKVVSTMLKALGGGDIGKGIERFIPLLTAATIGVKTLRGALNTLNTVKGVFGVMTKGAEGLAGATGKIAKVGGGSAKALSGLTSISTSVLAFVAAIWVLTKIDMNELLSVIPKLGIVAGCMLAMEALAKVASKLKVSKAQVKNLTMLAAPIATFAAALWLVDKAIPNDLSGLIPKLGLVAGCIVVMGLLAMAAKAVKISSTQIINLIELALPIAAFAAAIWLVNKAIPDDFGNIAIKLAIVGGVIVAMGVLCAIATALAEVIIPGAIVIAAMGVALAAIGAGLLVAALGLVETSNAVAKINLGNLVAFVGILGMVSILLALIAPFAAFGAIGAIAAGVIGGGLLACAAGLATAQNYMKEVDLGIITGFLGVLTVISILLALIATFAVFGAVGAIATSIIGGGLLLTAMALAQTQEYSQKISLEEMQRLMSIIAMVDAIFALLLPFAALGAISSIATTIIGGGLVKTAEGLKQASDISAEIKPQNLIKLTNAITYIAELQTGNLWNNLVNMINTGILTKIADNVYHMATIMANIPIVRTQNIKKIKEAVAEFASISTGDLWNNISNLINSGMLTKIAENARIMSETFGNIKSVKLESIKKIKEAIEVFSQIKIEGNGLFEDKGGASDMLVRVAENAARIVRIFSSLSTDDLLDKLNTLEKALSRDGKGWPINWAQSFVDYINKLNEAKANFLGLAIFIRAVNTWDTASLLDKFNEFEKAISRDGKSWEPWYAEKFKEYINKLTESEKSFGLIDKFINNVISWNTKDLLSQFNDFEKAVSRDGKSWEPWYAERFRDYIKKLVEDNKSLDLVDQFIGKVKAWDASSLLTQFNDFEKAISRDGKAWEPWYAERFRDYIKKLVEDNQSLDLVDSFINKVKGWNAKDLLNNFNDFENAISRNGKSWEPWYAERFRDYIKKLVEDNQSLDLVSNFIEKVKGWSGNDLLSKFNELEKAISRDGKGWPMSWVNQFYDYIKKLSEGGGGFDMVSTFIDKVKGWATDDLKTQFDKFENAVSRGGQGWPSYWADQFGNYIKKLSGESNLNSVTNFIDHVMNWKTSELKTRFDEFENAVSRGGNGWPMTWAEQFGNYVKKLGEVQGSMDVVNSFIEKVQSWTKVEEGGKDLFTVLNDFEKAISRDGNGWPITWATQFKEYLTELSGASGSFDVVAAFIEKVKSWTPAEGEVSLLDRFNAIEIAISRNGNGWPINWATDFVNWMTTIGGAQESGAMDALNEIFTKALNMNLDGVFDKMHEIERIVSLGGAGYPINWATGFVDYWNEFSYLTYDFQSIKQYIETITGLSPEQVAATAVALVNSISEFVTAAKGQTPEFLKVGGEYAVNLKNGWEGQDLPNVLSRAIDSLLEKLGNKSNSFYSTGNSLGLQFRQGLYDVDYANSGWWAVQGFIDGANNRNYGGAAWWAGYNIAKDFLNGLKAKGEEGSPWKTTFRSGQFAGEGFALGIESSIDRVEEAMEKMANVVNTELDTINPSITTGNVEINGESVSAKPSNNVKNMTINNNIYNDLDLSSMMSKLRWEMARA